MDVLSREAARVAGLKRYFTGEPCKRGHIAERYVSGAGYCVECHRGYFKKWYGDHPEHFATKARRRRAAKPQEYKDNYDRWLSENYERKLTHNRNYRARRADAGEHTSEEASALLDNQGHLCANPYCRANLRVVEKQLDHIIALARRGSNRIENLQWLCEPCNRRKYSLDSGAWLEREAQQGI